MSDFMYYGFDDLTSIEAVKLTHMDWNRECRKDMYIKKGFWISQDYQDKKTGKNNMYGIKSPLYGSSWEDGADAFADRYTCDCKYLKGKAFENEICPKCNVKVSFKNVDYKVFGWISMHEFSIIQPSMYDLIRSLVGKNALKDIITFETEFDLDGVEIGIEVDKAHPFKGKGITWLKNNFKTVIEFYVKKKKAKADIGQYLLENKEKVFAKAIPVYNSILRIEEVRSETYYYNSANKLYTSIFKISEDLRYYNGLNKKRITSDDLYDIEEKLTRIQLLLMRVSDDIIFETIRGKNGFIRSEMEGARVSYSARNVIVPDPTLFADEVDLPYLTFVTLHKFEITACLKELTGMSESAAVNKIERALVSFDNEIYEICNFIILKYKPKVLVGRNPTIALGSIQTCKIRKVKKDIKNLTMSLSTSSLRFFNADFDGDVLNIISLKSKHQKKVFSKFLNPRKNFFISRQTGLFDTRADLIRDEAIGLLSFNTI